MLIEDTEIPLAVLPLDAFKAHLRLGTGFASDVVQDEALEGFVRAAVAAVEARTGKALIARGFTLKVFEDVVRGYIAIPVAPVSAVSEMRRVKADATIEVVDAGRYRLTRDLHVPRVEPAGALPSVPAGGSVEVDFTAGFGPAWADVPADLRQAVMLLAAHYYEFRNETALGEGCMPFGVTSLTARFRNLRLGAAR